MQPMYCHGAGFSADVPGEASRDVEPIPEELPHGMDLISHVFCYGLTRDELDDLSYNQIMTLRAAGLL